MPRLDRGIQYAAAYRFNQNCLGVLDRPVKPGDDSEDDAVENFRIAQAALCDCIFHEAPM